MLQKTITTKIFNETKNVVAFAIQTSGTTNSQVEAARNAAKSVFEGAGSQVYACSDCMALANASILTINTSLENVQPRSAGVSGNSPSEETGNPRRRRSTQTDESSES